MTFHCQVCGKAFNAMPSRARKGWAKCCSRKCTFVLWKQHPRPKRMAACHPDRVHKGHGLCASCYVTRYLNAGHKYTSTYKMTRRIFNLAKKMGRPPKEIRPEIFALFARQHNCEICGNTNNLSVDHDHKTSKIRGLLCRNCNSLIGFATDNEDILRDAIRYLMRKSHMYAADRD